MKLFLIYFLALFTALNAFESDNLHYRKSLDFHKEYLTDDFKTIEQIKHPESDSNSKNIGGIILAVVSAAVFLSLVGYCCVGCSETTYTDHAYTGPPTVITTNRPAVYTVPVAPAIVTVPTYFPDHHHHTSHHTTIGFSNTTYRDGYNNTHVDSGLAGTDFRGNDNNFGIGLGGTDFRGNDNNFSDGLGGTDFRGNDNNFGGGLGGTDFRGNDNNFGDGLGDTSFRGNNDNFGDGLGDTYYR